MLTYIKQLNLKNCDMVIWYANNLFTLQGLPNLTNPGHLQGLLNLTNPGHFNNDISLTSKSTSPSSYCVINRYTILWTITCCSLSHENWWLHLQALAHGHSPLNIFLPSKYYPLKESHGRMPLLTLPRLTSFFLYLFYFLPYCLHRSFK